MKEILRRKERRERPVLWLSTGYPLLDTGIHATSIGEIECICLSPLHNRDDLQSLPHPAIIVCSHATAESIFWFRQSYPTARFVLLLAPHQSDLEQHCCAQGMDVEVLTVPVQRFRQFIGCILQEQEHQERDGLCTQDHAEHSGRSPLTRREQEVLAQVIAGKTYTTIGKTLGLCTSTIKSHMRSIRYKLHVPNKTAAVRVALQQGWISLPPREERVRAIDCSQLL